MKEFGKTIFGTRLLQLRQRQKITEQELGVMTDISFASISNYEQGLRYPRLDNAIRIARYFGVSLDYLSGIQEKERVEKHAMGMSEYQLMAMRTSNTRGVGKLINGVMGLCGESGEVMDLVKKHMYQGHELDSERLVEELGDVMWYIAEVANYLGMDLGEVACRNIEKLKRRYPDGFDRERSVERENA